MLVAVIKVYKTCISPLLGAHCRFFPSCADYAVEVLKTRGVIQGSWLAAARVCRCHPFAEGGFDPAKK